MYRIARQILLVLLGFTFIGGSHPLLAMYAQPMAPMAMIGLPCDMAMPAMGVGHEKPPQPGNSIVPDCLKHMCCVTIGALPAGFFSHETTVDYSMVAYWSSTSELAGVDRQPEDLPPRTA